MITIWGWLNNIPEKEKVMTTPKRPPNVENFFRGMQKDRHTLAAMDYILHLESCLSESKKLLKELLNAAKEYDEQMKKK